MLIFLFKRRIPIPLPLEKPLRDSRGFRASRDSRASRGSSLLEVVLALSILSLFSLALTGGLVQMKKISSQNQTVSLVDEQVFNLIQHVQQNPNLHQKYGENLDLNSGEGVTLAWSQRHIIPVEECPHCPGRFTYFIAPERSLGAGPLGEPAFTG